MALPSSRNTNYAAGVDIKSVDLNALQDCIVGLKHGTLSKPLGASAFYLAGGTATLSSDRWTATSSPTFARNLELPVGTRIASVTWYFNRGGGGTMTFKLKRRTLTDNVTAAVDVTTRTDVVTTGWRSDTDSPAYTTVADESLWLEVSGTAATNIFGGCVLSLARL